MLTNRWLCLLLLLGSSPAWAQDPKNTGNLENAEVIIEKERSLELPSSERLYERMSKSKRPQQPEPQQYQFRSIQPPLHTLEMTVPAMSLPKESAQPSAYTNYARLGAGNYLSLYGEGYYSRQLGDMQLGASVYHRNFLRGPVDGANSASSSSRIELEANKSIIGNPLSVRVGYQQQGLRFYGYEEAPVTSEAVPKQGYHLAYAQASYRWQPIKDLEVAPLLQTHFLTDRYHHAEIDLTLGAEVRYHFDATSEVLLRPRLSTNRYSHATATQGRGVYALDGAWRYHDGQLRLQLGAGMAYSPDSTSGSKKAYLYPALQASYALDEERLWLTIAAEGGLDQRTLRTTAWENPFLQGTALAHTYRPVDAWAGVYYKLPQQIGLRARAGYKMLKNAGMYVNGATDQAVMEMVFDDMGVAYLQAEASYQVGPWSAMLTTTLQHYRPETELEAWHLPTLSNLLEVSYRHERFSAGATFQHLGGLKARAFHTAQDGGPAAPQPYAEQLKPIFDMGLKGEYFINKQWGAFLQIDNLFSQSYQRYWRYDARGIQVMAGASYQF